MSMSVKVVMPHKRPVSDGSHDPCLLIGDVEEVRAFDIDEAVFWITEFDKGPDVPKSIIVAIKSALGEKGAHEGGGCSASMGIVATRMFYDHAAVEKGMQEGHPLAARVLVIHRTNGQTDQLAASMDHDIYVLNDKGDTIQRLL